MKTISLIFDRDGTLIKHIPYLQDPEKVELLPYVKSTLKILFNLKIKIFLHTNQSGISRGYFKLIDALRCNQKMKELIGIDNKLFLEECTSVGNDFKTDKFRKPSPFFGNKILKKYNLDKNLMYYVGDSISDLKTAQNIGCKAIGINTGLVKFDNSILKEENINVKIIDNFKDILEVISKN